MFVEGRIVYRHPGEFERADALKVYPCTVKALAVAGRMAPPKRGRAVVVDERGGCRHGGPGLNVVRCRARAMSA